MRSWKEITWECCPECGQSPVGVYTDCTIPDHVIDGDEARCPICAHIGGCCVDEDNAWVDWDNWEEVPEHELPGIYYR